MWLNLIRLKKSSQVQESKCSVSLFIWSSKANLRCRVDSEDPWGEVTCKGTAGGALLLDLGAGYRMGLVCKPHWMYIYNMFTFAYVKLW